MLEETVEPLTQLLHDDEPQVRMDQIGEAVEAALILFSHQEEWGSEASNRFPNQWVEPFTLRWKASLFSGTC